LYTHSANITTNLNGFQTATLLSHISHYVFSNLAMLPVHIFETK